MANEQIVAQCLALVAPAEAAFHSRWRLSSLKRVDADLHGALVDQQALYDENMTIGSPTDARLHAEAMVRGWSAACRAMEGQPEDAYLMGMDDESGIQVVIAEHKGARAALVERYGEPLVLMTPNEVASLLAVHKIIAASKAAFIDAELVAVSGVSALGVEVDPLG